jgi:biotin synthase
MIQISEILNKDYFTKDDLIILLQADREQAKLIFEKSYQVKKEYVGTKVYYRGLIEFSNICSKDCYYCGIRLSNKNTDRYEIGEQKILEAAKFAFDNNYASVVLQSGERSDKVFINQVDYLLKEIKKLSDGKLGITISLGEQTEEVYKRWFESGAHRYLLRIETTNRELYGKIHPQNEKHSFDKRIEALNILRKTGYQVGTGVMVGLPFQTIENLADDLIFFREFDIDMNGMGPFIEHEQTPLWEYRDLLMPQKERLFLTFKMIAILRIMMKDINIAAATALQAIDPLGREKALKVGANIIMPNITPTVHRKNYQLYQNKPCIDEGADDCTSCLEARINLAGDEVGYGEWGDSWHYKKRIK